jgi:homoserine O-succinyltransferase/O-acetyltransferase
MPLIIEGGTIPPLWAEKTNFVRNGLPRNATTPDCVRVALINNMPDPALEDTELQFFELLDIASEDVPVYLKLYSINEVPRTDRGERRLNSFYSSVNDLWNDHVDALIMTGTEPRSANLQDEPYWHKLGQVFDWAETNTVSTILSCLAAHAGVLYSDGIGRHRLPDKQFGVFDFEKSVSHRLTANSGDRVCFPHSRWNEVRAGELAACGYQVLTQSADGGVDCFVKKKKRSLFVHFQGHPEYSAQTLLKEYRRDIKRFLRNERETYPTMPKGYFNSESARCLNEFRSAAISDRREEIMERFPDAAIAFKLEKTWQSLATAIYRNWIHYVVSEKGKVLAFPAMAAACTQAPRRRSARP